MAQVLQVLDQGPEGERAEEVITQLLTDHKEDAMAAVQLNKLERGVLVFFRSIDGAQHIIGERKMKETERGRKVLKGLVEKRLMKKREGTHSLTKRGERRADNILAYRKRRERRC